jgi:hypothetical protein
MKERVHTGLSNSFTCNDRRVTPQPPDKFDVETFSHDLKSSAIGQFKQQLASSNVIKEDGEVDSNS